MSAGRSVRRRRRQRKGELTALLDVLFILLFAALVQAHQRVDDAEHRVALVADDAQLDAGAAALGLADAGVGDAGVGDAGATDAGAGDAGATDAGATDAGATDAGATDAGRDAAVPGDEPISPYRAQVQWAQRLVAEGVRGSDVMTLSIDRSGALVGLETWRDGVTTRRQLWYPLLREVPEVESYLRFVYRGDARDEHRLCSIARREHEPPRDDLAGVIVMITVDVPLRELNLALRDGLMADAGRCFQDTGGIAILLDPEPESAPSRGAGVDATPAGPTDDAAPTGGDGPGAAGAAGAAGATGATGATGAASAIGPTPVGEAGAISPAAGVPRAAPSAADPSVELEWE